MALMLAACSHSPVASVSYVLPNPSSPLGAVNEVDSLVVQDVHLADYLNQGGFVIKNGEVEITVTQQHRWGESLDKGIKRYLNRKFAGKAFVFPIDSKEDGPALHCNINLTFDAFEANTFDTVAASGFWEISKSDSAIPWMSAPFEIQTPIHPQTYSGIVMAFASLLDQLALDVEEQLDSMN